MRYSFLLLLFWFSPIGTALGQMERPSVMSIRSDTTDVWLEPAQFQLLEDPSGKLTFEQVRHSNGFHPEARYRPSRQARTCWVRVVIRNEQAKNINLYYSNVAGDYADVYWLDSSRHWQYQRLGNLIPWTDLTNYSGYRSPRRVLISLKPNQQVLIYQRSENIWWHGPLQYIRPQLITEKSLWKAAFTYYFAQRGWLDFWLNGIVVGIMLLAIGYNILVYRSTRERVYLYFGLCVFFYVLERNRSNMETALFEDYPFEFQLVGNYFFIFFFCFFIQAIRRFVPPDLSFPRLNKAIPIGLGLTSLIYVVQVAFLGWNYSIALQLDILLEVLIRIVYGLCLWLTFRLMRQKNADAQFIFIAITPLAIWWLFTLISKTSSLFFQLNLSDKLPQSFEYAEGISFAWMIIFFSAALTHRNNLIRQQVVRQAIEKEQLEKERSRLIAEQNERLERQVHERTAELQQSLEVLRATQNQLIQNEKLASLGELTAGIAHEIQNPLNFVNNFAEVSIELVEELQEEERSETETVSELLGSLKQNLQKIDQHGKRAGAIVRGMLEHSRSSTGEKTIINLNDLVNEYLQLAYHGARAKDKAFNCKLETDLAASLPTASVMPQEMGRVLLNLLNNAFYAVQAQRKENPAAIYHPTVWVQTRFVPLFTEQHKVNPPSSQGTIEVRIRDNGTGIPNEIRSKIFQPFFTTKPAGQGTGLGLSLSYDIITKGHGGKLSVESQGGGTEFIIRLPVI